MAVSAKVDGGIARVVLDHPPLNILTRELMGELRARLGELAGESSLRVVVLGAEGRHFSAGASVEEHLPPAWEAMIPEFVDTVRTVHDFPLPVVAAVRGRCLGG
ncbi:MAG TPA: enoyl-CoA hydratase/isomerase family protein, partial [Longimicrobiales bacterium]|nr:enoyl-CoA hydratase/isomerase family protein [Longimicrobiales bacterium]